MPGRVGSTAADLGESDFEYKATSYVQEISLPCQQNIQIFFKWDIGNYSHQMLFGDLTFDCIRLGLYF